MSKFALSKGRLVPIKEKAFKFEKEIQQLIESNLHTVMGLELVKSELTFKNKRIDTLAFDHERKAFIIIEYKRDKNISVVDQGFTYLSLMLANKADFIIEYNESLQKHLKRSDVDWSQTRVVFVSTGFTENQKTATDFKDIAIELWEVKRYENDIVSITPIKKSPWAASIKPTLQQNKQLKKVQDEITVYNEEYHLEGKPEEVIELYERFKHAILNLHGNMDFDPKKVYQANNEDMARHRLEEAEAKWGDKYKVVFKSWNHNWERLTNFYKYPPALRRLIYTTNPIESYHRMVRKVTKTKGAFNSETAILKQIYLATVNAKSKWNGRIFGWKSIRRDLHRYFEGRFLTDDTVD